MNTIKRSIQKGSLKTHLKTQDFKNVYLGDYKDFKDSNNVILLKVSVDSVHFSITVLIIHHVYIKTTKSFYK